MGEARKHHFISRCYLQGFTHNGAKNSKLFVVSLDKSRTFECVPSNVAHVRDFNRLEGFPIGALDNALGQFEGLACGALREIERSRSIPSHENWNYVMNMAALFAVRHPTQRENIRQFMSNVGERIIDLILAQPERYYETVKKAREAGHVTTARDVSYEEMKDFHQRKQYKIQVSTNFHVEQEMKVLDTALETFSARNWTLFFAAPDAGHFVTSDRPLMLLDLSDSPRGQVRHVGHATRGTMVVFPISKSALAIGTYNEASAPISSLLAEREDVARFNGVTVQYAYREVYASSPKFQANIGSRRCSGADVLAVLRDGED